MSTSGDRFDPLPGIAPTAALPTRPPFVGAAMTPQQIAQRADAARTAFDAWVAAQIRRDPGIDPFTLVTRAIAHFRQDPDFMGGWFAATMQDRVAALLARQGGAFDAPAPATAKPAHGNGAAQRGNRNRATTKAPSAWQAWLATERVPRRTKLMRRGDLVAIVAAERREASVHATNARLAEALLARLPEGRPDLTVGDVWTDEELGEAVRASLQPAITALPDATDARKAI